MKTLITEVLQGPREPPSVRWPHLPRAFDSWFLRSCALDPRQRWQTARDQTATLVPILGTVR
jgi:hypothetical protein